VLGFPHESQGLRRLRDAAREQARHRGARGQTERRDIVRREEGHEFEQVLGPRRPRADHIRKVHEVGVARSRRADLHHEPLNQAPPDRALDLDPAAHEAAKPIRDPVRVGPRERQQQDHVRDRPRVFHPIGVGSVSHRCQGR